MLTKADTRLAFVTDGYVIARDVFKKEHHDSLVASLHSVLLKSGSVAAEATEDVDALIMKREQEDHALVYNVSVTVSSSAAAYRMIGDSGLIQTVAAAMGHDAAHLHLMPLILAIQIPQVTKFDYQWHQESTFYKGLRGVVNVWFPILRSSAGATGSMSIIPGSHRNGQRDNKPKMVDGFRQIKTRITKAEEASQLSVEIDPCDAIIFDGDLVHRSMMNQGSVPRLTGILRVISVMDQIQIRPLYKALSYDDQ